MNKPNAPRLKMPSLLKLAIDNLHLSKQPSAVTQGDEITIYVHGVISKSWGDVDTQEFAQTLANSTARTLHLRINSPGGDVFDARSMMTAISQFNGKTIAHIDGVAASAATAICMACNEVEIAQGANFMIHNAWTLAMGNKADMAKAMQLLEKTDERLVEDYARRSGQPKDTIRQWMDDETWFSADEALNYRFADRVVEVVDDAKGQRTWDLSAYSHAPPNLTVNTSKEEEISRDIMNQMQARERRLKLLQTYQP